MVGPTKDGGWAQALVLLSALALLVAAARWQLTPPASVPATAPATEFSAERALVHLRAYSAVPHPMGSPEHEAALRYLVDTLTGLGLRPEIQVATGLQQHGEQLGGDRYRGRVWAATVHNIVARIPGTANTGALLLTGHYDSVPTTPGASDGGSGTATILETARALLAGPRLRNDVILLFTDADVAGLLGSGAFMAEHPWRNDFTLALRFEGMGTHGPSGLFHTSHQNGWLVREALKAAPHPLALLAFNDLGLGSPDLGEILSYGATGLGFAYGASPEAHHTALDHPDRIDPRSLQHDGSWALALVRHFGNQPMGDLRSLLASNVVAFNLVRGVLVWYPATWVRPMTAVLTLLLLIALGVALRRKRLTGRGLLLDLLTFPIAAGLALAAVTLVWVAILRLNPNHHVFLQGFYGMSFYLAGCAALALALLAGLDALLRARSRNGFDLRVGALFVWWGLLFWSGRAAPSLSYAMTWPLLAAVLVLGWQVVAPQAAERPWLRGAVLVLGAAPAVLLTAPIFHFLALMMARRASAPEGPPLMAAPILVIVLVTGLLLPLLREIDVPRPGWLPAASLAAGLVFLALGVHASAFSPERPRPDHIAYVQDADAARAEWVSAGASLDAWTRQFFPGTAMPASFEASPSDFPGRLFPAFRGPAPVLPLAPPRLQVVEDRIEEDLRTVHLHLDSPRGAPNLRVEIQAPGEILGGSLDGRPLDRSTARPLDRFWLMYFALPKEGIDLVLTLRGGGPLDITLTDYSNGLPQVPGMAIHPRLAWTMPGPYGFADPTVVRKVWRVEGVRNPIDPEAREASGREIAQNGRRR